MRLQFAEPRNVIQRNNGRRHREWRGAVKKRLGLSPRGSGSQSAGLWVSVRGALGSLTSGKQSLANT
ncbi:hypothetical protein EYF80_023506 [Liparis tanakae]|uniref:Uncharacterized protein n=1 Tax=Liparis tanakae TaxID=230148 RepID=A0A4Z2HNA1_9TELE|nr:hypothetical protein EYF80_023506 [Liparis tanakae]